MSEVDTSAPYISGRPATLKEARRWIASGLKLVVMDPRTDRPIKALNGRVSIFGKNWEGIASIADGIVIDVVGANPGAAN